VALLGSPRYLELAATSRDFVFIWLAEKKAYMDPSLETAASCRIISANALLYATHWNQAVALASFRREFR
jgi:hypothetical protein